MKILITGSNGLLGQKLSSSFPKTKLNYLATSQGQNRNPGIVPQKISSLDITNSDEVSKQ